MNIQHVENVDRKVEFTLETKLFKRRWLQLGLSFVLAASICMHGVQLSIIGNIVSRYFNVSGLAVDWTNIISQVMFVIMMLPRTFITSRVGFRCTCVISTIGTSIGSWIKFFSVSPDHFIPLFIGQATIAASEGFALTTVTRLVASWFSREEVATATAICFLGAQAGLGAMSLIAPIVVRNHEKIEDIGKDLSTLALATAIFSTVVTVAILFFFKNEPSSPPSEAEALKKINLGSERKGFWSTIKRILTNKNFLMIWNSYGITSGTLITITTLLNPIFLAHFQNSEADAGKLGLVLNLPGSFISIIFAFILDRTKNFRALGICTSGTLLVGEVLFAVCLTLEIKWMIFMAVLIIRISAMSCGIIQTEWSTESSYPEPEEFGFSIFMIAPQIYGTILTLLLGNLLRTYGDTVAHACLIGVIAFGLTLTIFTKAELRREKASEISKCAVTLLPQLNGQTFEESKD